MKPLEKSKIKNDNNVFKFISVGRAHWNKGYSYALDACKLLKDSGFLFKYVIVGGADAIEYQYQVHDLGLDNHVTLLEYQDFYKIQDLLQQTDLFLFSNINEQTANVVIEAMSLDVLVLSTSCRSVLEVIDDGINGFLVPKRDVKAIADKIRQIKDLNLKEKQSILKEAQHTILEQQASL